MVYLHESSTSLPTSRGWAIWPNLSLFESTGIQAPFWGQFESQYRVWAHWDSPTKWGIKMDAVELTSNPPICQLKWLTGQESFSESWLRVKCVFGFD